MSTFAKISINIRTQGGGNILKFQRSMNASTVTNQLEGVTLVLSATSAVLFTPTVTSTLFRGGVYVYNLSAASAVVASQAHVNLFFSGQSISAQKLGLGKVALLWPGSTNGIRVACNSGSSYYVQWGRFTGM